jgi:hypothetical protein
MKINRLMQVVFVSGALSAAAPVLAHAGATGALPAPSAEESANLDEARPLCGEDTDEDEDGEGDEDGEETIQL